MTPLVEGDGTDKAGTWWLHVHELSKCPTWKQNAFAVDSFELMFFPFRQVDLHLQRWSGNRS